MKKIVFIVLTLLLLTGLCLGIGFSAMAAESDGVNALEQTIMADYAPAEIPADAKPVGSYGAFVAMDPDGVYYLTADFRVTTSYMFTFEGELYGNGHTLTLSGAPMFTKLDGATVCDLTLTGSVNNAAATKLNYVGGLTREAYDATIVGVVNKADVNQEIKEMFAGGVAGYAENTTFKYCVNYGTLTGHAEAFRPGGIMGQCDNDSAWIVLENCINHGTINGVNQTGGLVSRIEHGASLRMTDCANFGTVNVSVSDSGGVIGKVTQTTTEVTMERCYNSGTVNAGTIAGGVMGYIRASKLTLNECYNGCFVDGCDCKGTVHGYITQKKNGDLGGIVAVLECSGITEITITNCSNYGVIYSPTVGNRIGGISGCMEGKTFTAKNCHNYGNLTSNSYGGGLFGRAGASAGTLTMENCSNNGNITVNSYAGGLVGYQQYSLAIKVVNCVNNGTLSTNWNAGGILCRMDGNTVTMTGNMEFINCVNNGDIVQCSGTAGGILGIAEIGDLAKIPNLIFTNCQNNGDITFTNYAGGMAGIAYATNITMSNCTNTGDMIFNTVKNANEYGEVGGLAGRLFGKFSATDCLNTGNVLDASGVPASTRTESFVLGGIVGRVGQAGTAYKVETTTLIRCINTGIIGGSRAIADAATTYAIVAGGMVGNARSACYAYNCVNTGDMFGNQQVAGICALSGQNEQSGHTYYGNVVFSDIYNSGHKGAYNSAGAAGLSCYGWGNVKVERNLVTGNIEVNNTGSGKAIGDRWACSALFGYTNNPEGDFKYNYFTGTLTTDGGDNCYLILVANTKGCDHTSREGNQMVHNYSVNQYNLHCNEKIGYSVSKSTSITPEAMKALLPNNFTLIKTCDGTVLPMDAQTVKTYTTALDAAGHTYGDYTATADPNNHSAVCACGDVIYEAHSYDNACDVDCNDCGYVRTVGDHEGAFTCSETCRHCGETITPKADHAGAFACSTICETCGTAIVSGDHTVSSDCDTTCDVCGETVAPVVPDHVLDKPCDSVCSACGADVEGSAHTGKDDCSTTCRWCGTAIQANADHDGLYDCSNTCQNCGTAIRGEAHTGAYACSTTCQWCGTTVTPDAEHTYDNACDTACNICGETRTVADHEGAFDCSVICKDCGTLITPAAEHVGEFACSEACRVCGAAMTEAEAHTYDNACDTDCNVCGAVRVAQHVYDEEPCDADCNVCGFVRNVEHSGEHLCSDICRWCGVSITPVSHHVGLVECSEICQWCAGQVADEDRIDHTYDHNCDTVCNVCATERTVPEHQGVYPCDDVCQWCEAPIANPGAHVYDNSCDASCNNCGAIRLTARHAFDNDCDPDCNKSDCDYVREVAHGYDNDCDKDCNKCGETRETEHVFDNACDNNCNVCGYVDIARDHVWDNVCDDTCNNGCGTTRETAHAFAGPCSGHCTKCDQQVRPDAHTVDTWETVIEPTVDAEGQQKGVCSFCGQEVTQVLDKKPADADEKTQDSGSMDIYILVIAAAALVVFNIIVILVVCVKKKKAARAKNENEKAETTETTEK